MAETTLSLTDHLSCYAGNERTFTNHTGFVFLAAVQYPRPESSQTDQHTGGCDDRYGEHQTFHAPIPAPSP